MDHDSSHGNDSWLGRIWKAIVPSARPALAADALEQLRGVTDWQRSVETHLAHLQAAHDAQTAAIGVLGDWQRSATAHLAGLQNGHDALGTQVASLSASAPPPVIEWMRSAEAHIRALQAETERVRSQLERHEDGLASLKTGLSQLELKAIDLEHADTVIAAALAREPGHRTPR